MEIREIKARLSIVEVLRHYGLESDGNSRLHCPFHRDRTPSLQLYPSTNTFTCFSTRCTAGSGDVIDFIRLMEKSTPHGAIMQAKRLVGHTEEPRTLELLPQEATAAKGKKPKAAPQVEQPESVQEEPETISEEERRLVLEKVWHLWRVSLNKSTAAREYLQGRGIVSSQVEAGYNGGGIYENKPEGFIRAARVCGLLLPGKGKKDEIFARGCVLFALRNRSGQVVSFYGRSMAEHGKGRHFYQRQRQGLYPEYPESTTERLILTESVIDAASLLGTSYLLKGTAVLALYGTNGFSEEHREAIGSLTELREIVLFFDGDEAGGAAVEKWSPILRQLQPQAALYAIRTPEGEDVNSLLVERGEEYLSDLLRTGRFLLSREEQPGSDPYYVGNLLRRFARSVQEQPASDKTEIGTASTEAASDEREEAQAFSADSPATGLDTSNPYALVWRAATALYTVLGGVRQEMDSMKVTLRIESGSGRVQRIKVDLYHDEQTERSVRRVADKLELRPELMERDLVELTDALEQYREQRQREQDAPQQQTQVTISTREQNEALALLRHAELFRELHRLIGESGVVGEEQNRLLAFCCCSSYKSGRPLHLISQGASGQGKTHLQEAIARLMPPEDVLQVTRVSEYGFYHFGENQLSYKLFICEDLDGMGEEALLALREMQSKGWIAGVVTMKDDKGNFTTRHKIVRGPLATAGATTRGYIYEDNSSRCFVIAIDESEEQTKRIIEYQSRLYAGKIDTHQQGRIQRLLQNAVRLLEPLEVVNPYAEHLSLPEGVLKRRRTNAHYHELIKTITWLHQYQRRRDDRGRLITEKADIVIANRLIVGALVSKMDDLDGSLRHFFERLKTHVKEAGGKEYRSYVFGRKELRERLRISKSQQHRYLCDLEELDYIRRTSGTAYGGFRYRVEVWDDAQAERQKVTSYLAAQIEQL